MSSPNPPSEPRRPNPGRRGNAISLHPLTPDDALRGLLRVKPADLKRVEDREKADKKSKK
jgi:hypothetical protein